MNIDFSTMIIGVLLVGALFAGVYSFTDLFTGDDAYQITLSSADSAYADTFHDTQNTTGKINEQYDKLRNDWQIESGLNVFVVLIPDAYRLIKSLISLPIDALMDFVNVGAGPLNVPPWLSAFILAFIVVVAMFTFVSIITKWRT